MAGPLRQNLSWVRAKCDRKSQGRTSVLYFFSGWILVSHSVNINSSEKKVHFFWLMHADSVSNAKIDRFCCQKETHFVYDKVDTVTSIGESAPSHTGRQSGPHFALLYEKRSPVITHTCILHIFYTFSTIIIVRSANVFKVARNPPPECCSIK